MKNPNIQADPRIVLDTTEARQATPKRTNLRVLVGSLTGIAILGAVLLFVFFRATPAGMDATPTGAEAPAASAPAPTATQPALPVAPVQTP
ncbi:MAG: hypothetical protein ABL897_12335 [Hyphomicrobium sp.]